jgi:Secretion system C-terminal sorting domain
MKKILFSLLALCCWASVQAQTVNVVVKLLSSPNRLGLYITGSGFVGADKLSGLTTTIKWSTGCGAVSLGTFSNNTTISLSKQVTGVSGGFNYVTIDGDASSSVTLVNSVETLLGTIPIVTGGATTPCDFLASKIHNHPNPGDGDFYAEKNGVTALMAGSDFISEALAVVLPTELLTFKGNRKGTVSQLQWEATNEKNLINYIVERSTDGRNFRPLGFTKPKSFNATEKVAYDFIDDSPEIGINYYRLLSKGTGKDEKYSKVISLDFGLGLSGRVFPNPLDGDLTVELDIEGNSGDVEVGVYDVVGKQVLSKKMPNSDRRINFSMPTTDLPPGAYIIKIKVGTTYWERKLTKM